MIWTAAGQQTNNRNTVDIACRELSTIIFLVVDHSAVKYEHHLDEKYFRLSALLNSRAFFCFGGSGWPLHDLVNGICFTRGRPAARYSSLYSFFFLKQSHPFGGYKQRKKRRGIPLDIYAKTAQTAATYRTNEWKCMAISLKKTTAKYKYKTCRRPTIEGASMEAPFPKTATAHLKIPIFTRKTRKHWYWPEHTIQMKRSRFFCI